MKKVFFVLATLLALAAATRRVWDQPPRICTIPDEQDRLESRVSRLEAAVEKLQREISPRVIPLAKDQ
jgi:hypothetical protein